jgi:hypothetical protein
MAMKLGEKPSLGSKITEIIGKYWRQLSTG